MTPKDIPLNTPFEHDGETLVAVPNLIETCYDCYFEDDSKSCCDHFCGSGRDDNTNVIFVRKETMMEAQQPAAQPKFKVGDKAISVTGHEVEIVAGPDKSGYYAYTLNGEMFIRPSEELKHPEPPKPKTVTKTLKPYLTCIGALVWQTDEAVDSTDKIITKITHNEDGSMDVEVTA